MRTFGDPLIGLDGFDRYDFIYSQIVLLFT